MQGDMCDVRNQDCSAVFVLSDGIEQIDTLTCKIVVSANAPAYSPTSEFGF